MQTSEPDFQQDYFQLFGLARACRIDQAQLERQFRALQTQVHPDKYAHLSDTEQRLALQRATLVNEAYQIMRTPLRRARYLLSLHGVSTQEENNNVMPVDFLLTQMEWREAISEAQRVRDTIALAKLETRINHETHLLEEQLALTVDTEKNYEAAASLIRKLRFMEKISEEIHAAYDAIDT